MRIICEEPPGFDKIDAAFNVRGKPVIFCYGSLIYNPMGVFVTDALVEHEKIHSERQGSDVDRWWERYIDDIGFRLQEEIPAHRAEYRSLVAGVKSREIRNAHLHSVAVKLAGPLYGGLISLRHARTELTK